MIRAVFVFVCCLLATSAMADMYQDASNSKLPQALDNIFEGIWKKTSSFQGTPLRGLYVTPNTNNWALQIGREVVGKDDQHDVRCWRNVTYPVGGSYNTCFTADTNIGAGTVNPNEWNALFRIDSSSTGTGGTVLALYAQAWRRPGSNTAIWASVHELQDHNPDPVSGAVTAEINQMAMGGDANSSRIIVDVIGGKAMGDVSGVTPTISTGIRITGQYPGALTNVHFKKGLDFGVATWDTLITTTPSEGHTPTFARGVDFTSGICTDSCFRSNGFRVDGAGNTVIGEGAWNGAAGYGWLTLNGTSGSSLSFDLAAVEVVRQQVSTTYFSINNFSATSPTLFVNNGNTGLRLDPNGSVTMANLPVSAGGGGLAVCVDTAGKLYKKAACP